MRCMKRNIGHLCHDEPREAKKPKTETPVAAAATQEEDQEDSNTSPTKSSLTPPVNGMSRPLEQQETRPPAASATPSVSLPPPPIPPSRSNAGASIAAPAPVSVAQRAALNGTSQACRSSSI